jgi:UDP-N-acetylglucosamine 2-epimerase (non-hydrolysing)
MKNSKLLLIAGTRPNFMKIAPLALELDKQKIKYDILHTGQHYDQNMNQVFFDQLKIKSPIVNLNIKESEYGKQVGHIMIEFAKFINKYQPSMIIVVGDVSSTVATALVASQKQIKVCHFEAGARSEQKTTEEINRKITDIVSDYLFVSQEYDKENLLKENYNENNIFVVGDLMADTLLKFIEYTPKENYILVTLHRDYNVDIKENLETILKELNKLSKKYEILFKIHPRTRKRINEFKLTKYLQNIKESSPIDYISFIKKLNSSKLVITDSGGIQTESTILKVPCISVRDTTGLKFTVEYGSNTLCNRHEIYNTTKNLIDKPKKIQIPDNIKQMLDGNAAQRAINILKKLI